MKQHPIDFQRDGYLIVDEAVGQPVIDEMMNVLAVAVDKIAHALFKKGLVSSLHENLPVDRRLVVLQEEYGSPIGKLGWNPEVFGPALYNLVCAPRVLDTVEMILGPEVNVHGDYWIRPKLPQEERTTIPWHQDSMYYGENSGNNHILTVWIPLVDVNQENGCLEVIPGSHTWGLQKAHRASDEKAFEPLEDPAAHGEGKVLPMKAGDLLAFSNITFHRSSVNTTEVVRWSADLRYSPVGKGPEAIFAKYPPMVGRSSDAGLIETLEDWRRKRCQFQRTSEATAAWNTV